MSANRPNIVLLTIDAWRADFVDAFNGVPLLPVLQRYADRTVRFERCYANGPWTTPGLLSLFTGEPVLQHGVHFAWSQPRVDAPALGKAFAQAGYSVPNLSYLTGVENYWNLGWDRRTTPSRPQSPADPTVQDALGTLAEGSQPGFLWFHYKWVHLPYATGAEYRPSLGLHAVPPHLAETVGGQFVLERHLHPLDPAHQSTVRAMYAAGVRRMNDWLEQVFEHLEARGLMDDTVVVLTSDHGEELLERGHVGHASTAEHAHLYEEVLRIPLLVIDPRVRHPRTVQTRVQGLDLFPTLHTLAGLPAPACHGVDLTPAIHGAGEPEADPDRLFAFHSARRGYRTPKSEQAHQITGLSDGRWVFIDQRFGDFAPVLYDLQVDPEQRHPITEHAQVAPWLARLAEHIATW